MPDDTAQIVVYPSRTRRVRFTLLFLVTTAVMALVPAGAITGMLRSNTPSVVLVCFACVFGVCATSLGLLLCLTAYRLVVWKPSVIVNAEGITDRCSLIGGGMGVIRWQEVSGIFPLTYSWNPNYAYLVIVPWHKGTALGRRGPLVRIFLRTISLILPGSLGLPDWLLSVPAGELWNRIHERFRECLVANDIVFPHRAMAAEKGLRAMDWKIELLIVPVSDVDRAKAFYADQVGFHADHDQRVSETLRFVQLTPPGSTCSIAIGEGITDAAPGSASGIQMVVPDINAAHAHLAEHGVAVSDIEHLAWGSFVYFADPDGNRWSVQQLPPRG